MHRVPARSGSRREVAGLGRGRGGGRRRCRSGLGRMRWARVSRVGRVGWMAVRRVPRRHRLAARSAGAGGRSFLGHGRRQRPRACRASRLPAGRAEGCADRRRRILAARNRAAAGARANGRARGGNHHRDGECGDPGADPGPGIPSMPGRRGAPPAAAGCLVTARVTHEPPAAGRRRAPAGARTGPSACIPPCDRGWQRQFSNGDAAREAKPDTGRLPGRGCRREARAAGPRSSRVPSAAPASYARRPEARRT